MLAYHPGKDPYHGALRQLRILTECGDAMLRTRLSVLDFYYVFPNFIQNIRFPQGARHWRTRLKGFDNKYWTGADEQLLFTRLQSLQEASVQVLAAKQLIRLGHSGDGSVEAVPSSFSNELYDVVKDVGSNEKVVLEFFDDVLCDMKLQGKNGLKARTGLMEYRYDVA